jgi:hypothetical protein
MKKKKITSSSEAELIRTGAMCPAKKRVSMKLLRAKPPTSRKSIVETLLEERREGR